MVKPFLYLGDLDGPEGNAFAVLGAAQRVAKENGLDWDMIQAEAKSSDYEHLLNTMKKYFTVHVIDQVKTKPL